MASYWCYCINTHRNDAMIKDELYPDYEEHHIEILNELDLDEFAKTINNGNN